MTVNKQKKNVKQRGSKTHGYGSMKKHRGAGSRGGRGNAGSGKRGDVKKPSFRHEGRNGRHGFSSPVTNQKVSKINLALITQRLSKYVEEGIVKPRPASKNLATISVYNIEDRSQPKLEQNISSEGSYRDARMIGDYVYMVSQKYVNIDNPEPPVYIINGVMEKGQRPAAGAMRHVALSFDGIDPGFSPAFAG